MTPEELRRDRQRFHAHTATFLLGVAGWLFVLVFHALIVKAVIPWLLVVFSVIMIASGVLAISVGRTFISGPAGDEGPSAPYGDLGDALGTPGIHTFDLVPSYNRAVAPYTILGLGLALLALSGYWAVAGMP